MRCEGGSYRVGQPKTGPNRAACPSCGRITSFHRITGRFASHVPPTPVVEPIIVLDPRRRTSLGKVGRKQDTQYLVTEHPDGTLVLTPAVTVPVSGLESS